LKKQEVFLFLNSLFPISTARDFDNPGFLVGDPESPLGRAVIALDCTLDTLSFAIENDCDLIITHHPVIFSPIKNVLSDSIVYKLINNGISVISLHTNLDVGTNGVNDALCNKIGLKEIAPHLAPDNYLLKYGVVTPITAENFAQKLSQSLKGCVKYVDGGNVITKVLVCSGSGGDYIEEAINNGFDALVTADVKHHHFLLAKDNKVSLFDAGHYNTEDIIVDDLKQLLSAQFEGFEFLSFHPNVIKFEYTENLC